MRDQLLSPSPTMQADDDSEDSLRAVVAELVELQRIRKFAIKGQQWCNRRSEALIASHLGYDPSAGDEQSRAALFKRAAAIRVAIERTKAAPVNVGLDSSFYSAGYADMILASARSRLTWDEVRAKNEGALERSAKGLPVYPWARTVRGFGERGLAIITAEAAGYDEVPPGSGRLRRRMIGEYRRLRNLYKRMGLGVIDGQRQRKMKSKEDADRHRYKPGRRAECWTLAESLLRAQLCSELRACKEAIAASPAAALACSERGIDFKKVKSVDALRPIVEEFGLSAEKHATGPYGEVYLRRRAETLPRVAATADLPNRIGDQTNPLKWTPGRCHNDAVRIMFKALLKDLRSEWRRRSRGASLQDTSLRTAEASPS
jgi:hypothetical protein